MDWLGDGALADTASWGLIVGLVLPWLTAVVQQPTWSNSQRKAAAIAVAAVAAVGTCLANGTLDEGQTVLATFAVLLSTGQALYRGIWKGNVATAIELATSPKPKSALDGLGDDVPL